MTFWTLVLAIVVGEFIYTWFQAATDVLLSRLLRKRIIAKFQQQQMDKLMAIQMQQPMGRAN